jgi:hypothetical protein
MTGKTSDRVGAATPEDREQGVPELKRQPAESSSTRWVAIAGVAGFLLALLIYILRLDNVVGMMVDDGWYVLLAKSLATGQGYSLINSPTPGILPLYPPGFPFLLSIFYRLHPNFPDNLWLLKSVSVAAMMGVGILSYLYFRRDRALPAHLALGIAFASTICPPLVSLATSSVMSECVFALALIATVVVVERGVRAGKEGGRKLWLYPLASALLASFAFLTRSVAIGLLAAIFLYFLKVRMVRAALIFAFAVALFAGPWVIYSRIHAPTPAQQKEQGGHIVQPYTAQFWQRVASDKSSGSITAGEIPSRVWNNFLEITGRDIFRVIAPPLYELMRDPYEEARKLLSKALTDKTEDTLPVSFVLSVFLIVGFISVIREKVTLAEIAIPLSFLVIMLWPWETIRFVLPMTPFVLFYFLMGFRRIHLLLRAKTSTAASWAVPAVVVALVIGIHLYGNAVYISKKLGDSTFDRPQWLQTFDDAETLFKWVDQSIPENEPIVTLNPPLVHLYTGHKTVAWEDPVKNWESWKQLGIRYLVWVSAFPIAPEPEQRFYQTIYRTKNVSDFRVVDLGPVEKRGNWGESVVISTPGNPSER